MKIFRKKDECRYCGKPAEKDKDICNHCWESINLVVYGEKFSKEKLEGR